MSDEWITITEAIGRIARAKGIKSERAIHALRKLAESGRISAKILKLVAPEFEEPRRNVAMTNAHWDALSDLQSADWFTRGEAHFSDEEYWLGIQIHADDLEREIGALEPADDMSWAQEFWPVRSYVTLAEALSWIAFRQYLSEDQIHHTISNFGGELKERALSDALETLIDRACEDDPQGGNLLTLKRRCAERTRDGEEDIIYRNIDQEELNHLRDLDFRAADVPPGSQTPNWLDGAVSEEGAAFDAGKNITRTEPIISLSEVMVRRDQLLKHFSPPQSAPQERAVSTAKAERDCEAWLHAQLGDKNNDNRAKGYFKEEALKHFSGRLSGRGFNRAWARVAPACARTRPGRKPKS